MEEKPNINFQRFQPQKMAAKYWIKWLFYGLVLVGLWFWYQQQMEEKKERKQKFSEQELQFKKINIQED